MNLEHLSSETLTARIGELLSRERRVMVAFLFHLAELERRQLHLAMGFSSVFVYCTDALHLSKASAFRRTAAARLLVRFPVAAEYLESGALCLTTLVELRDVLTDENHHSLLPRAAGKTEDEVRDMIAALRPKPAPTDLFRRVPMAVGSGRSRPDTSVTVRPETWVTVKLTDALVEDGPDARENHVRWRCEAWSNAVHEPVRCLWYHSKDGLQVAPPVRPRRRGRATRTFSTPPRKQSRDGARCCGPSGRVT